MSPSLSQRPQFQGCFSIEHERHERVEPLKVVEHARFRDVQFEHLPCEQFPVVRVELKRLANKQSLQEVAKILALCRCHEVVLESVARQDQDPACRLTYAFLSHCQAPVPELAIQLCRMGMDVNRICLLRSRRRSHPDSTVVEHTGILRPNHDLGIVTAELIAGKSFRWRKNASAGS